MSFNKIKDYLLLNLCSLSGIKLIDNNWVLRYNIYNCEKINNKEGDNDCYKVF